MNQKLPENFNWVSVRAECSPTAAFLKLRSQVEEDVNDRIKLMPEAELPRYSFTFRSEEAWKFWVLVRVPGLDKGVLFIRSPHGIEVRDVSTDRLMYDGHLTLANDGECKLKVGESEYSFWQFRKLALEDILFTSVAKWRL